MVIVERLEDWQGAANLRDLGGLALTDGAHTLPGVLCRSGRPETTTPVGWTAAAERGLTTVVDLRCANETGPRQNADGIEFLHRPIEDQTNKAFIKQWGEHLSHPHYYPAALDFFPDLMANAFTAIAEAPGPVLFHCSAGRDRTGLMSALLLRLNGATTESILDDYERGVRGYNDALRNGLMPTSHAPARSDDYLVDAIAERRTVLAAWIRALDVGAFLRNKARLPETTINRLSTMLRPDATPPQ